MAQNPNFNFSFELYNFCLLCNNKISSNSIFCVNCYKNLNFISNGCKICSKPIKITDTINNISHNNCLGKNQNWCIDKSQSLFPYQSNKKIAIKIKTTNDQYLYTSLIKIALTMHKDFFNEIDLIIPTPIHWKTKFLRGFDQSILIAEELSQLIKIKLEKNVLIKRKQTKKQSIQSYKDRFINIKDSFLIKNNDIIKNKNILLIDDIITTGATSNECAKLLKKNGAKVVKLFTLFTTVLYE